MWGDSSYSIRKKLTNLLLLTSLSVLSLATIGFAFSDYWHSKKQTLMIMQERAAIIGSNSLAALTFNDQKAARATLLSLNTQKTIVAAALYDAEAELFASYQRDNYPLPRVAPDFNDGVYQDVQFVLSPIILDGEKIGSVLLLSELSGWREQQMSRLAVVLALFLLAVLAAIIISHRVQRYVTRPILALANTARAVTERQDFSVRAEKNSEDEIGELVEDFNEMLNHIQCRDNELNEVRDDLEKKVTERTSKLYDMTKRLEYQARHDALTGLVNRVSFDGQLQAALEYGLRRQTQQCVFFLDLDRFKAINDTLGHGIGDRLLVEVAKRLSNSLRKTDILARLGGDEFAVLLQDTSASQAAEVADKLIKVIHAPMRLDGYQLQVSTSLGISLFPDHGISVAEILKNADTAMYYAKESGRNRFSFYQREMNAKAERRLSVEGRLRHAIQEDLFQLYYQPKWDINSQEMVGVEALLRWNDEQEGMISPEEFIPIAEDCGLIEHIDNWVLETACREIASLFKGERPKLQLSVNLSVGHFIRQDVFQCVADTIEKTAFPGDCLELEITETVVSTEIVNLKQQLDSIRDLGIEISIDDFGIAYSSLSRLKQLPLNTLKIDRSFILDIGHDKDDEVIVKTIIDMAHNLNLKVVAEGVETPLQFEFVKSHHCDVVQGFLFGKPMPLDALAKNLREEMRAFEDITV